MLELLVSILFFTVSVFLNKTMQNAVVIFMAGIVFYYMYIQRQSQMDMRTRVAYVVSLALFFITIYNLIADFFYKKPKPDKDD